MITSLLKDLNLDEEKTTHFRLNGKLYFNVFVSEQLEFCPKCNNDKIYKNGVHVRNIIHSSSNFEPVILKLHLQKFLCPNCKYSFKQNQSIAPKNESISTPTILLALDRLMNPSATFASVAKDLFLNKQSIINVFDRNINYSRFPLSERLSFDEKHTGGNMVDNYAFIILDWVENKIIDICPSRKKIYLERYFRNIPLEERLKVKSISIDMWETYKSLAKTYFPNAIIAIDSFHVMKNINKAMNTIRIKVMNKFDNGSDDLENNDIYYYMLKKYGYYFLSELDSLSEIRRIPKLKTKWNRNEVLKFLLAIDDSLKECYELVRDYREFNRSKITEHTEEEFDSLIERFYKNKYMVFKKIGTMLATWKYEILNSLISIEDSFTTSSEGEEITKVRRLSNGPIEGANSILDKIISNGNGYTNFKRFRNRAILCVNKEIIISNND